VLNQSGKAMILLLVAIAVLFAALVPLQNALTDERLILGLDDPSNVVSPWEIPQEAVSMLIGGAIVSGFRNIAADLLWIKGDEYWDSGRWWDMLPVMRAVTMLDPHFIDVWRTFAWHVAYNLGAETKDPVRKRQLLDYGMKILREGIRRNPDRFELYFEAGWMCLDKGADPQAAADYFEKAMEFKSIPDYVYHMMAHAYEDTADIGQALAWWQKSFDRNRDDRIAQGAITTINLRYVPAWRAYRRHDYKKALKLLYHHLKYEDPQDKIALHFIARIYEETGQLTKALAVWQEAASARAMDYYAHLKVDELKAKLAGVKLKVPSLEEEMQRHRNERIKPKPGVQRTPSFSPIGR